jgi:hypothetical protein
MNEKPEDFADEFEEFKPNPPPPGGAGKSSSGGQKLTFKPTLYQWRDPKLIPPRAFIGGRHLIRKFLSATVAPGGLGKSTLVLADAVALASGRKLHSANPNGRFKVWYWNGEDPKEEIERRIVAIMKYYEINPADLGDRLSFNSGRDEGMEVIIGAQSNRGITIARPVEDALIEALAAGKFDVLVLDPFVATHRVSENDNMAIDAVAKTFGRIADRANCAIELVHHVRKTNGNEITAEDGRGASALIAAARSVRVLNPMTKEEAEKAKIEAGRKGFYFRSDIGKANLAPPSDKATWFRLESVDIGNGTTIEFLTDSGIDEITVAGDVVGVATGWKWPEALDGVHVADLMAVRAEIAKGRWKKSPRAADWVGVPIAAALKLDSGDKGDRHKISKLIETWIKSGMLKVTIDDDETRHPREWVGIGEWN